MTNSPDFYLQKKYSENSDEDVEVDIGTYGLKWSVCIWFGQCLSVWVKAGYYNNPEKPIVQFSNSPRNEKRASDFEKV